MWFARFLIRASDPPTNLGASIFVIGLIELLECG